MSNNIQTVADLTRRLQQADAKEYEVLRRSLASDSRRGVIDALKRAEARLLREKAESERLAGLYLFQKEICDGVVLGLDEVGRGPLAGPLAVGGVVLRADKPIYGLDDSKKLSESKRSELASTIRHHAIAWTVVYVDAHEIDRIGITASLRNAFLEAIANIEGMGSIPDCILLDGNPLHLDPREVSVVKGDAQCASIAAASIVAKESRDALMCQLSGRYPEYDFASNKGYASAAHCDAIRRYGISDVHRRSFCTAFLQDSLF